MAEFLGKSQVQIASVQPDRVKNLAGDLTKLFGAVETGLKTYNQIGAQTAQLDFMDKANSYNDELAQWKQAEVDQEYNPDFYRAYDDRIAQISAEIVSGRDVYKDHKAAYEAYDAHSSEFAYNLNSQLRSSIMSKELDARRRVLDRDNELAINKSFEAGTMPSVPQIKGWVETANKIGIDGTKYSDKALTNSLYIQTEALQTSPTQYALTHGLIVDGKLNPDFEKNVIRDFEAFAKIGDDGSLAPTADYVTNHHLEQISDFIAKVRIAFKDKNNNAHNSDFQSLLEELKTQSEKVENGSSEGEGLTTLLNNLDGILQTGTVGDTQKRSYDDAKAKLRNVTLPKVQSAQVALASLPTNQLKEALVKGYNKAGQLSVEAQVLTGQAKADLARTDLLIKQNPSFQNYETAFIKANRYDMKSEALTDLDAKIYSNRPFESFSEAQQLVSIANGLTAKYPQQESADEWKKILYTQALASELSVVEKTNPKATDAEKLAIFSRRIIGIRNGGVQNIAATNKAMVDARWKSFDPSDFDKVFNLGTTRMPTASTQELLKWSLARAGHTPMDQSQLQGYVNEHTTRVSFAAGKAFLTVKMRAGSEEINEKQIKNAVRVTLMANGKNGSLDDPNVSIDQIGGVDPTNPEAPNGMYLIVRYNGVELPNGRYTPSDIIKLKEAKWTDYSKTSKQRGAAPNISSSPVYKEKVKQGQKSIWDNPLF